MEHKVTYLFTDKAKAIQGILENNCWPFLSRIWLYSRQSSTTISSVAVTCHWPEASAVMVCFQTSLLGAEAPQVPPRPTGRQLWPRVVVSQELYTEVVFPSPRWLAETKKAIKQHNPDKAAWLVFLSCVGLWPFTFVPGSLFSWTDRRWGPSFHFML